MGEVCCPWWMGLIRHAALRRATFSTAVEKAFAQGVHLPAQPFPYTVSDTSFARMRSRSLSSSSRPIRAAIISGITLIISSPSFS